MQLADWGISGLLRPPQQDEADAQAQQAAQPSESRASCSMSVADMHTSESQPHCSAQAATTATTGIATEGDLGTSTSVVRHVVGAGGEGGGGGGSETQAAAAVPASSFMCAPGQGLKAPAGAPMGTPFWAAPELDAGLPHDTWVAGGRTKHAQLERQGLDRGSPMRCTCIPSCTSAARRVWARSDSANVTRSLPCDM